MQNGKKSLKVSDKIELRLPDPAYAKTLYNIIDKQRKHLRPWLSWVDRTQSVAHIQEFLRSSQLFNEGGQKLTTFIFKEDVICGSLGLVSINKEHHYAELGYWLHEDFQGNGIITQSCQRLIQYAFQHLDLNRIEIKVASPNSKSQAIPARLGFTHEATLRSALFIHNQYFDLELFSLLKQEWTPK